MRTRTLTRMASVLGVLALFAGLLATSANAGIRDGRSPDTKDAAYRAHLDGRSPDTIDAAAQAHATPAAADLRSPDTRDAAAVGHATPAASIVLISNGGFHWTDAGIGAAGGFAIALIVGGAFLFTNWVSRGKLAVKAGWEKDAPYRLGFRRQWHDGGTMQNTFVTLLVALALALVLAACGSTKEANFPNGKLIKAGTTNYGLIFNEDGTYSVFDGSSTIVRGTYSVDGDTYTDKSNNAGCLDEPKSFKYTFDGTNLTFNYIGDPANDACDGRRGDFNNVTYALSK